MKQTEYNGYPSWSCWNVALWVGNDEGLYREAVELVTKYGREKAARVLAARYKGERTPDAGRRPV